MKFSKEIVDKLINQGLLMSDIYGFQDDLDCCLEKEIAKKVTAIFIDYKINFKCKPDTCDCYRITIID